jgi:RNA recognition motif-containing protein
LTAEGYSIYVKGLPGNATPALLENEFKKFGPIKSGGIQVRCQKVFHFIIACFFLTLAAFLQQMAAY